MELKKKKTLFSQIYGIVKCLIIIVIIIFAGFICLQRFTDNKFSIFGFRMFSVATGSMAPMYNIGDVLLIEEVDTNTLVVGDDITYIGNVSSYKDKVVTHRITRIENKEGELLFHTKGIASVSEDPVVNSSQVYGKVFAKLELLSFLHTFISKPIGFFVCIIIPILFLIGSEIIQSMLDRYELNRKNQ